MPFNILLALPINYVIAFFSMTEFEQALPNRKTLEEKLFDAILSSDAQNIGSLITEGANVNAKNPSGVAPLHLAVAYHDRRAVQLLIDAKAQLDIEDNDGRTPLYIAISLRNTEIVRSLIDARAQLDIPDKQGHTPLMWACLYNNLEAVALLIECHLKFSTSLGHTSEEITKVYNQLQEAALNESMSQLNINGENSMLTESEELNSAKSKTSWWNKAFSWLNPFSWWSAGKGKVESETGQVRTLIETKNEPAEEPSLEELNSAKSQTSWWNKAFSWLNPFSWWSADKGKVQSELKSVESNTTSQNQPKPQSTSQGGKSDSYDPQEVNGRVGLGDAGLQPQYDIHSLKNAIDDGEVLMVQNIINANNNLLGKGIMGYTPLCYAISAFQDANMEIVSFLFYKEKSLKDKSVECQRREANLRHDPLCIAAEFNQIDVMKFLVESGCEITSFVWDHAAHRERITDYLLSQEMSQEKLDDALRSMAYYGDVDTCKKLVDKGADVRSKDKHGQNALDKACNKRHVEVIKALSDINHSDRSACQENKEISVTHEEVEAVQWPSGEPQGMASKGLANNLVVQSLLKAVNDNLDGGGAPGADPVDNPFSSFSAGNSEGNAPTVCVGLDGLNHEDSQFENEERVKMFVALPYYNGDQ